MITIVPVACRILYYRPDHRLILNEFIWGFDDRVPDLPRFRKFMMHWKDNIEATINTVYLAHGGTRGWRRIDLEEVYR